MAASAVDLNRKADGGVIFPKNGNCPDKLTDYWREGLPHELFVALRSIAEEADGSLDENFDATSAVIRRFADLGIEVSPNPRLICFLTAQIDDYLRRRKSTMIARSLLDLPVTIRGDNWEHIDFSGCRAKYDPDSDFVRTRELLDQSAAILDMSPNSHRGPHDRALRAAGRYTTFLTNRTKFYADNFSEVSQFTFQFTSESIRECVELALSRPRETVEMGMRQGSRMRELLTLDRYIDQVTTVVDACALACGGRPAGTQEFVRILEWHIVRRSRPISSLSPHHYPGLAVEYMPRGTCGELTLPSESSLHNRLVAIEAATHFSKARIRLAGLPITVPPSATFPNTTDRIPRLHENQQIFPARLSSPNRSMSHHRSLNSLQVETRD